MFVMSGWRGILVFSEIRWKDSKWSSNENLVSISRVEGGAVTGRAREILASVSNTREKVPEGNGYIGKRECLPLLSTG